MRIFLTICATAGVLLNSFGLVNAQGVMVHRLKVAANSSLALSNPEIDEIIKNMNYIISSKFYTWDASCPNVSFARDGDVVNISDPQFPLTGTFDELRAGLTRFAPAANVMVVSGVTCSGVTAAGCGAPGQQPMIVGLQSGQWTALNGELWLHERGHNVGLPHSAEAPATEYDHPLEGKRFMFWQLGSGHLGKTAKECDAYLHLPAIQTANPAPTASSAATAPAETESQGLAPLPAVVPSRGALTEHAFEAVGYPWLEGAPLTTIKSLNKDDLDSIRALLRGQPNQYWPQALQTLAIAGGADDVDILQHTLSLPMPAVLPNDNPDIRPNPEILQAQRILLQTKLVAPKALGILANRTGSSLAVETLTNAADLDMAEKIIGPAASYSLSKNSIGGLSISNTPNANAFINENTGLSLPNAKSTSHTSQVKIAPLSEGDKEFLKKSNDLVQKFGVEAILRRPFGTF